MGFQIIRRRDFEGQNEIKETICIPPQSPLTDPVFVYAGNAIGWIFVVVVVVAKQL